ncbi:ArsB/NhaD family transporter [Desulfothermus sp.]
MKKTILVLLVVLISSSLAMASHEHVSPPKHPDKDAIYVNLAGIIKNTHGEPVGEAEVKVFLGDKMMDELETAENGKFLSRFFISKEEQKSLHIKLEISKASYKTEILKLDPQNLAMKDKNIYFSGDIILKRVIGPAFWVSAGVFFLVYVIIGFELLHRTIAAMLGAATMLILSYTIGTFNPEYHILSYEAAIASIDMNVIFLLMGMMIIIGVLKHTGIFQWCAYKSYSLARGNFFLLSIILMFFTAFTSAFLDNVTTMLLLTGVAIEICVALNINPLYLLIPLVMASNIGGTATLIGDPPNILIGSYAGLSFVKFVEALAPICLVCMVVLIVYTKFIWGKEFAKAKIENVDEFILKLKEKYKITDAKLLSYGGGVLAFVIFLFLTESIWHMEVSVAALFGAAVLVTIAIIMDKIDLIELIEKDIEWPTLMFFIFLFMLVSAVESTGLLDLIADWILKLSKGNFVAACTFILWVAAIMSAFVDNIPFTATMLPIVGYLSNVIPEAHNTLWWALALGACFGGNGTIIGASANVVTIGIAESKGYRTTFMGFMKVAFPYMIITIAISEAWLLIVRPG